jgi:hypothetical protein
MSTRRLNYTRAKSSDENQNLVTYHTKGRDAIKNLRNRKIARFFFAARENLRVDSAGKMLRVD